MDYVEIIERYVLQAWSEGKTTVQIKDELAQKRWPPEMVEAVIDRLVKKKVEKKEGKLPEINGPDFWAHPTWPVGESWALLNRQRAEMKTEIDENYSKSQKKIEKPLKNKCHHQGRRYRHRTEGREDRPPLRTFLSGKQQQRSPYRRNRYRTQSL